MNKIEASLLSKVSLANYYVVLGSSSISILNDRSILQKK
ncbi:hypothetical protein CCACVL1_03611 [Corchorus capsularis]|uniref:Uncharacterized protein n=1 Tax=Corchorus capsularis TaxID=210143 RepID=A0A1R3JYB5_COCAP|nr:hypothetical protein CCACVL1_03611 [Corchorus capsularis]